MKFIIMAGGQGTKLWPISKENKPKQFINIVGSKTLFQLNVESLLMRYSSKDIFVSTTGEYTRFIKEQTPMIPEENYIIEPPFRKMTGPACGYAMLRVAKKYPDEVVMFYVQPVVLRNPAEKYLEMVAGIEKLVRKHGKLVTGGKHPLYPETGSDYLQLGKRVKGTGKLEVYDSVKFVERKKTMQETKKMMEEMQLCIHCNHWAWTADKLFKAFKKHRPDWYKTLMEIKKVIGTKDEEKKLWKLYKKFKPGNFDPLTAPLHEEGKVQVVILPFNWAHITTWNDVYEYYKSAGIETQLGQVIEIEGENNLIISTNKKLISTIGLKDCVIIETDDAILICTKDQSGKMRYLLDEINARGYNHLL